MAINRGFEGGFGGGSRSFHEQPAPRDSEPEALAAASKAQRMKAAETVIGLDTDVEKAKKLIFEYKNFPLGWSTLPADKRAPSFALEKGKSYLSVGKVDKRPFTKKLRSTSWYENKAKYASSLIGKFDKIVLAFPSFGNATQKAHIANIIQNISAFGNLNPATFKKELEAKYSFADLYGAEGAFNVILAYQRAVSPSSISDDKDNVDIELHLASERSVSVYERGAKKAPEKAAPPAKPTKEPTEKPAAKPAKTPAELAKEKAASIEATARGFNHDIESEEMIAHTLYNKIDNEEGKRGMPAAEVKALRDILRGAKFDRVPISREPDEKDVDRLADASTRNSEVKRRLEKVDVKLTPPSTEPPVGLPGEATPTKGSKGRKGSGVVDVPGGVTPTDGKSFDRREKEGRVKDALTRGNVKEFYAWKDDHGAMAKQIANEVLAACDPATDMSKILVTLEGMALAKIREAAKVRTADEKQFRLDEETKINMVDLVLTQMKAFGINRRTEY